VEPKQVSLNMPQKNKIEFTIILFVKIILHILYNIYMTSSSLVRIILHVDIDAFYASAEQSVNSSLRNKPLIVGADPKEGRGRGVVLTASYEARKYGVRSGQPISQAYRLCPNAIYVRPNWQLYEQLSSKVMATLKPFADKLEQVSIDEAFLDITSKVASYDDVTNLVRAVKNAIKQETGLTCSIGVAPNKSVAKIASDFNKPDGLTIVNPHEVTSFLLPLSVSKISGVGPKSQKLLEGLGIRTIGELASHSVEELTKCFGKNGVWMWNIANGIDRSEVVEYYQRKSISAERTFEEDKDNYRIVHKTLDLLSDEVAGTLKSEGYLFKTGGIKVRFADFETQTRVRTLKDYTDSKQVLSICCKELFKNFEKDGRKIRLVGVRVSGLKKVLSAQKDLLAWIEND
jgi:DNA polymerase IV (DinB-like DNA polymerase)